MACEKLGSKPDRFQRKGRSWFYTAGLQSDVIIEISEVSFHLHKFPLVTRSRKLAHIIEACLDRGEEIPHIDLSGIPGGPDAFELAVKFCYGVKLELTAANVVPLRCVGEYLEMSEDFGEGNLIARTEGFLNQVVLRHWKECIRALSSCAFVFSEAKKLGIVSACVDAIALNACTDPSLLGWPMPNTYMQSPKGSFLWNGISTGARPSRASSDWWYDDIAMLSLPLYKRVIVAMQKRGIKPENIAGALMHFARRHLPALHKRNSSINKEVGGSKLRLLSLSSVPSEGDQTVILETIESLLPMQKDVVPIQFLSELLQNAIMLSASADCRSNIERRIGLQLEHASLEDLLLPNRAYNAEILYDIDCVRRIVDHFLFFEQSAGHIPSQTSDSESDDDDDDDDIDEHVINSPSLTPMRIVARVIDNYLAEVAADVNLKASKFQNLAEALPSYARISHDGFYRAIDIYLKAHPWLREEEKERLCRLMDCQKLSLEACSHAAQNERLPLRIIVQVLFFEQLQLRTVIASCFMIDDDPHPYLPHQSLPDGVVQGVALRADGWANAVRDNQALKVDMDHMKRCINKLERECSGMHEELEKLRKGRASQMPNPRTLGGKLKSHICRTKGNDVEDQSHPGCGSKVSRSRKTKHSRH